MNEGRHEEATILNNQIIEMTAFFDTLALNQSPAEYSFLFEDGEEVFVQNRERTLPITVPINLDNNTNRPALVRYYSGTYSKGELIAYLSSLKSHLGSTSFSLQLSTKRHAINLNYDSQTEQWLLIDPNHLPGKSIAQTSLVVEELLADYAGIEGLVLKTKIYTINSCKEMIARQCLAMENTSIWKALHALTHEKVNGIYDADKRDQLYYNIIEGNVAWITEASNCCDIVLGDIHWELLDSCEPNGIPYSAAILAVIEGIDLDSAKKMLFEACCKNNKNVVVMLGPVYNSSPTPTCRGLSAASRRWSNYN